MNELTLQILSYLVVCLAVVCYCVLDGFDLGVGSLHLFTRSDTDRRIFLNAIGPLWDGNAVWLVIVGGGLFVAFPPVYATLLSAFYTPAMLLLFVLILRAVAIEFRSKKESKTWRNLWDTVFSFASILIAFCVGVIIGNLITGIQINADKVFIGSFWSFFQLYPVCVGIMSVALFSWHGLIFLLMKTEDQLHDNIRKWTPYVVSLFTVFYILTTISTILYSPHMIERLKGFPAFFIIPAITILCIILTPCMIYLRRDGTAFIFSSIQILGLFALFGIGTFPTMIRSSINPELFSITLENSAASRITQEVFLTIVVIGAPLVLAYGIWIYHLFRGKVKLESTSY